MTSFLTRRAMVARALALGSGAMLPLPAWARSGSHGLQPRADGASAGILSGEDIVLTIGHIPFALGKREGHAVTVNGLLPAPLLRLREGQDLRISVTNTLAEDTSIHWHGLLLPFQMDGVPGISFPGIAPGETFTYAFPVRQAGTYWYHSHSNMQEAMGLYGAIVIDPADEEPAPYDREHVLVLSDWSFLHPHTILRKLKQQADYFNRQKLTVLGDRRGPGMDGPDRRRWAAMRMDPSDISDVTGTTYTYLVNGHDSAANWIGLFRPGERVRLRIVNASAMTNFNVRIPGLGMTVVQADGQDVQPVETDEFQIAVAETYDVIVRPMDDRAYGLIAEALDRSALVRATLAPRMGMIGDVPVLRDPPLLAMKDMGMDHGAMGHGDMDHSAMPMRDKSAAPGVRFGPGVASISPMPQDRTGDRPTGLEDASHRVLTYRQLRSLRPNRDTRAPSRQIDVHLTANMERYMWSFDGVKLSERPQPLAFRHNERVRVNLVNDTMMPHPIHLHGHFFEVVTGAADRNPLKHTVNVLPGAKVSFDLTADALGDWAFHCHMLMHMHSGMFRVVTVRHAGAGAEKHEGHGAEGGHQ
jgi:FtsP/CotA-like multicopper oxidase with cupredoxin domain